MSKMTKVWFAQMAGRIAKNAAAWSSDSLDLIDDDPEMRPEDAFRFTADMRSRLDRIDEQARAALPAKETAHD